MNVFATFLGDLLPKYEQLLILGDFNIHVCCAADSLAKEFLNLLNAFDLTSQVNIPTHQHGHTLNLILTHGFSFCDLDVCENGFSDHKTVVFTFLSQSNVFSNVFQLLVRLLLPPLLMSVSTNGCVE